VTNRLQHETSPYLRQHADNPVDWYPWGEEAFARARAEDRPILLSIGYSACHWCHVMAHESFEDEETAALMNRLYVNIKVDREEHPDVDQVYQHALQLFSEHGGWPLTMFLLPDGRPFYGGTYFPPQDRFGRPSFRRVLTHLAELYRTRRDELMEQGQKLVEALFRIEGGRAVAEEGVRLPPDFAVRAAARLAARMDPVHGGFAGAPKFPSAPALLLQLRGFARSGDAEDARPVLLTLRKMAEGGIYDQLGGGFHRYSTDDVWLVPHFEKMLYDNGLLLGLYAHGLQIVRRAGRGDEAALYERILRETLGWLEREMRDASGGLYAAQDADSEGVEGKYFVFSPDEVEAACGPEAAALLCRAYGIVPGGNWNDPHGHGPRGKSILHVVELPEDEAGKRQLAEARARLLAARQQRVPPGTDDKILTGWNALAIGGLAEAARVLPEPAFADGARRTAAFLLTNLREERGALLRTYKDGVARLPATLDDHAFLAQALLHLASATGELHHVTTARGLCDAAIANLYDAERRVFYLAPEETGGIALPVRPVSLYDSAIPSGLSVMAQVLLWLAALLPPAEGRRYQEIAERVLLPYGEQALRNPFGLSSLCAALDLLQHGLTVTVIVCPRDPGEGAALLRAAHGAYVPDHFVLCVPEGARDLPAGLAVWAEGKRALGAPTAYVCQGQRCSAPLTEAQALADQLCASST
jgi:hypothetical protein